MGLDAIRDIKILDPSVSRAHLLGKRPDDVVGFRLIARVVTDEQVRRLNEIGCQVTFLPTSPYPISCRARLDLIPAVLTEGFIGDAKVEAVDFTPWGRF